MSAPKEAGNPGEFASATGELLLEVIDAGVPYLRHAPHHAPPSPEDSGPWRDLSADEGLVRGRLHDLKVRKVRRGGKQGSSAGRVQSVALKLVVDREKAIDAFIQVACPRISTDNQFDKPVLSSPQANALLKILRNESLDEYFERPHWL